MADIAARSFRDVGKDDAIANGSIVTYYLDDRKLRISVARVENRLYAFDDLCTCAPQTCPLSGGLLIGTVITCQCHGSRFDISNGSVVNGPATKPIKIYAVREAQGSVQIQA